MALMTVRTSEYEITEAMITYGGGFVSLLGRLIRAADHENKRKLVLAFPEYMHQYDDIAVRVAERAAVQAQGQPEAAGAVDPHVADPGTPTPRALTCLYCSASVDTPGSQLCPTCTETQHLGKPL